MGISGGRERRERRQARASSSAPASGGAAQSTRDAWDQYHAAFNARDLSAVRACYDAGSTLRAVAQDTAGNVTTTSEPQVHRGVEDIAAFHAARFAALDMARAPAAETPVVPIVEDVSGFATFGHVYFLWEASGEGVDHYGVETFIFHPVTHKILRQNVAVYKICAQGRPQAEHDEETEFRTPQSTPTSAAAVADSAALREQWDKHVAAFRSRDDDAVLSGYDESSVLTYFEVGMPQKLKRVRGLSGILQFHRRIFNNLRDRRQLSCAVLACDKLPVGGLAQVFAAWVSPTDGYVHATDTAVVSESGWIVRHNITTLRSCESPTMRMARSGRRPTPHHLPPPNPLPAGSPHAGLAGLAAPTPLVEKEAAVFPVPLGVSASGRRPRP